MQDGSTCYDISEYYPLLDEIYDNSKPDSEPWTPKWLIKEHLVALVSRPRQQSTPFSVRLISFRDITHSTPAW